jgi:hypothetical protein
MGSSLKFAHMERALTGREGEIDTYSVLTTHTHGVSERCKGYVVFVLLILGGGRIM